VQNLERNCAKQAAICLGAEMRTLFGMLKKAILI
jgi:hypothetical protein